MSMEQLKEEELTSIEIDLTNGNKLEESFLRMFGFGVKAILNRMFGGASVPVTVKGNASDVSSFARTIGKEKRYMDAMNRYGLDNPKTFKSKSKLTQAINSFERKTGVKWPFK